MRPVLTCIALALVLLCLSQAQAAEATLLRVVTTLPDYACLAREIGGDRVTVSAIVSGDQDAHFIRPKPSFVSMVKNADVLISTGLDLELWLPTVVDKSGNARVRSGMPGYVAAAQGMHMLEIPASMSRIEGGVHAYGNPHVTCSPLNMKVAAANIASGLITNDPAGRQLYEKNLAALHDRVDRALFGGELVDIVTGETLCRLADNGTLVDFLAANSYQGKPLLSLLGGWMGKMLPLRGMPIVTYHKNWVYFTGLFGLEEAGNVEPKPGIPPSARHVTQLVDMMKGRDIRIILAANYFDEQKTRAVASKTGARAVIVPLYVGGAKGADDYFALVDCWVDALTEAAADAGKSAGPVAKE